ncbi:MAG TPA: hypothetical protein PLX43_02375 [Nitrobacter sp.]|nr:hypothetical protein [Nitrobacter sp.]
MLQTDYAKGGIIAPTPDNAGEVVSYRAEIDLATSDLTLNNIIEMGPLPGDCDLVDVILDTDDLDSGTAAITLDVGIMSGDFGVSSGSRTCGAEIFSASTVAQAGGVVRPTLATAFRIARSHVDRGIGVKIKAAPDTPQAGTLGLTVIYRG